MLKSNGAEGFDNEASHSADVTKAYHQRRQDALS